MQGGKKARRVKTKEQRSNEGRGKEETSKKQKGKR